MENTKTLTLVQFFEQAYITLDSGDSFEEFIEREKECLDLYQQSTSQKETIERLREFIQNAKRLDDFGYRYKLTEHLKKAEQLLKETEPKE